MKRKYVSLLIAFLILTSLSAAFLHHHEGRDPGLDCSVCHFVKQGVGTGILAFFVLFILFRHSRLFSRRPVFSLSFFESTFQGRAPPSSSL